MNAELSYLNFVWDSIVFERQRNRERELYLMQIYKISDAKDHIFFLVVVRELKVAGEQCGKN